VRATCKSEKWNIDDPACGHMAQAGENGCPVAHPTAGAACTNDGLVCQMLGGDLCVCSTCLGGPCLQDPHWGCAPPPTTEGCPETAPALECLYGVRCVESISTERKCEGGVWVDVPVACPL
jgi:hypothetical protein